MWASRRRAQRRNEEYRCAFCGVALHAAPTRQVEFNEDLVVIACVPCVERKRKGAIIEAWAIVALVAAIVGVTLTVALIY